MKVHPTAPILAGTEFHYVRGESFTMRFETTNGDLFVVHIANAGWSVCSNDGLVAFGVSSALHPCTVHDGEWHDPESGNILTKFCFVPSEYGTFTRPIRLTYDIGIDYFTRLSPPFIVWYVHEDDEEPLHSGSKCVAETGLPGKRYCNICQTSSSANNFKSQHMRSHMRRRVCETTSDVEVALLRASQ